jgi:RimJ/RimL family protein N-acetyltransferase
VRLQEAYPFLSGIFNCRSLLRQAFGGSVSKSVGQSVLGGRFVNSELNSLGQPVGRQLPGWTAPERPERAPIGGRICRLEPLDAERHSSDLYAADQQDLDGRSWTYLPYGPFPDFESYRAWVATVQPSLDPLFYAIILQASGRAVGVASYLRIEPKVGAIEIGHLHFSPLLQRTAAATESLYLLMERAFALGYRRLEWKCDALNAPSRRAAQRLGLSFEGVFRQATVVKGRNRDTAWFAAIDEEWPALKSAFSQWLDPSNFDANGAQRVSLSSLTAPILGYRG